jgi:glycosyltransferase involved in cell wall biosynthesis
MNPARGERRRRPRVGILTSVHGPRDIRIFHREARALAAAGYDVTLIAPGARAGEDAGVRFLGLPAWGGRAGRPIRWPVLLWRAARLRADIFHLHDPELLPWGLVLAAISGRPVIYDSHEYLAESILTKHWIPAALRRPVAWLADRVEKACAARLAAVVTVTDEMADRFGRVQPRTVTVRNLPWPTALPAGRPPSGPVVIHIGLMNRDRGLGLLHATGVALRARHPGAEIRILGPVEWQGLPAEAARPAAEWVAAGVRFLGTVPQEEVLGQLLQAAVGWLPRDPGSGNARLAWPNKLGEYMMAGLPVVASDLPVQARIVRQAGCGLLVGEFTGDANAAALAELLADPGRARRLGEAGRAAALAELSFESQAAILRRLYAELLGPR